MLLRAAPDDAHLRGPSLWAVARHLEVKPEGLGGRELAEALTAERAAAAALGDSLQAAPAPAVRVETRAHVEAARTDEECSEARGRLRELLALEDKDFADGLDDGTLRRFLCARGCDVEKAKKLLLEARELQERHLPQPLDYQELEAHARLGQMRVSGLDAHGRAVVVVDGALLGGDAAAQLRLVAFNLAHAVRRMEGSRVEKYVIFIHLSGFSLSSSPPRALLKDAGALMSTSFPERCGNVVFHQAPRIFTGVYRLCTPFIDARTAAKFVFLSGDDSPGTANDSTLREVIGARWRELSGAGYPRESPRSSPGYQHRRDFGAMIAYECAWNMRDTGSAGHSESCATSTASIHEHRQSTDGSTTEGAATVETPPAGDDSPRGKRRRLEAAASAAVERAQLAAQAADAAAEAAAEAAHAAAIASQALALDKLFPADPADELGAADSLDKLGPADELGAADSLDKLDTTTDRTALAGGGAAPLPGSPQGGPRGRLQCWGFVLRAAGHTSGLFVGIATALGNALADHRAAVTNAADGGAAREPRVGLAGLLAAVPRAALCAASLLLGQPIKAPRRRRNSKEQSDPMSLLSCETAIVWI